MLIAALLCSVVVAAPEPRNFPYVELEGTVDDFRFHRNWRSYYWREDFTFVLRDAQGRLHRVISREPTPWNNLRLGTTFTKLEVDFAAKPKVKVIGVGAVDRIPVDFYDLKVDDKTVTAFLVRVQSADGTWKDWFVNNWFHHWGDDANAKVAAHFVNDDPNYTVYGYLNGFAHPLDAAGAALVEKFSPDWGGIIFHGRLAKTATGFELRLIHLMGRHKKSLAYEVFHGDPKTLVPLDGRKPRFTDVSAGAGLVVAANTNVGGTNPHAVAVADFDGDGKPDVVVPTFGAPHIKYFRNKGGLKFADVTPGSGLETFQGDGTGAAAADFDRDGKPDLYLTSLRKGACRLYRNKGDGTFEDVSDKAGVLVTDPGRSCAWSDIDGDGYVDLFVCCPDKPNRLFRNKGDGTFVDIAGAAGVALADRHSLGCAFGDVDGDGRDDLFVANYHSQNSTLFRNLGGGKFADITAAAGLERKASAVGAVFADVFNRGRADLLVTTDSWLSGANSTEAQLRKAGHTVEPNVLYANDGKGVFAPVAGPVSQYKALGHDAVLEDLDHDGLIDIYVGVDANSAQKWAVSKGGNPLWTRGPDGAWVESSLPWGVDYFGNCVCVPAVDFDGDGDLDLLAINFYTNPVLLRNDTNGKAWLQVKAVGTKSNLDGIGAKVAVYAGERLVGSRQIQSGAGYCRCSPAEAHFGLGAPAASYRVEVTFPNGVKAVREKVSPGTRLVVRESE